MRKTLENAECLLKPYCIKFDSSVESSGRQTGAINIANKVKILICCKMKWRSLYDCFFLFNIWTLFYKRNIKHLSGISIVCCRKTCEANKHSRIPQNTLLFPHVLYTLLSYSFNFLRPSDRARFLFLNILISNNFFSELRPIVAIHQHMINECTFFKSLFNMIIWI